ncbi:MAG: hypothetical protein JWN02_1413 [Acidobacteria bacterium]|nr:hypothetical protein [Acidobacteriota bacterium]
MTAAAQKRKLLGRFRGIATNQSIYEVADGIEIDESDNFEMQRRRVLYEDVLYVTHHREVGVAFPVINACLALSFFFGGAAAYANGSTPAALIIAASGLPFAVASIVRMIVGVDIITIFGRRSRARIRYPFRKKKARQVYGQICARTRQLQTQLARELRDQEAAAPPPPNLPGPPSEVEPEPWP